jgi:hypothetical protein
MNYLCKRCTIVTEITASLLPKVLHCCYRKHCTFIYRNYCILSYRYQQDHVYPFPAENGTTLWKGIRGFMDHYNKEKTHQGVGRRTPESMFKLSA